MVERVEKVEELKVEGLKVETKIKNVAPMNTIINSSTHPLIYSRNPYHPGKTPLQAIPNRDGPNLQDVL
jgi:hypothetical protein